MARSRMPATCPDRQSTLLIAKQAIDSKFRSPVSDPWDAVKFWRVSPGIVTLMNMACVAFMCHYNGVKYYEELENRSVKKYVVSIG